MPTVFSVLMITVMQCTVLNVTYDSSSQAFVCPKGDYLWPESTWGMKLGFSVGNIRNKGKGEGLGWSRRRRPCRYSSLYFVYYDYFHFYFCAVTDMQLLSPKEK